LQYLAWAVRSLWQIGAAGWETYVAAVVVLAAGSKDRGAPLR
jgi:hypothetical protein